MDSVYHLIALCETSFTAKRFTLVEVQQPPVLRTTELVLVSHSVAVLPKWLPKAYIRFRIITSYFVLRTPRIILTISGSATYRIVAKDKIREVDEYLGIEEAIQLS